MGTHEWASNVSLPSTPLSLSSPPSLGEFGLRMNEAPSPDPVKKLSRPSFERTRSPGMFWSESPRVDRADRVLHPRAWRVFCSVDENDSESSTPCSAPCPKACSASSPNSACPVFVVTTASSFESWLADDSAEDSAGGPVDGVVLIAGAWLVVGGEG